MQTGRVESNNPTEQKEHIPTTASSSSQFIQQVLKATGKFFGNTLPYALTNHTAHISGIPLLQLWQPGGLGNVMDAAEAAASVHANEICVFNIGPYPAAYIRRQSHIAEIYHQNHPEAHPIPKNGDSSGIYPYLFGHSILDMLSSDPDYPKERKFYVASLMTGDRLANSAKLMNEAISTHLKKYPPESLKNVHDLRVFVNRLILTMVAETQLGLVDLTEAEKDYLSAMVSAALPEMSNIKLIAYLQLEAATGYRPTMPLDKIMQDGYEFLQKLLNRNRDHILRAPTAPKYELFLRQFIQKTLLEKRQLTSTQKVAIEAKLAAGEKITPQENAILTLDIDAAITMESVLAEHCRRFAALVLFAGYESTATSTFFALMTLADSNHQLLLNELRDSIMANWDGSEPVTKAEIDKMQLLDAVVQENLRQHPPFPTFKDKLNADIILGDVYLKKGTIIFLSPYRTHRIENTENVEKPREFIPRSNLNPKNSNYHFFTFGPEPTRTCVGMHLAKLETKMLMTHLLPHYHFRLHKMTFPFITKEEYSLQLADAVQQKNELITFTKLDQHTNTIDPKRKIATPG